MPAVDIDFEGTGNQVQNTTPVNDSSNNQKPETKQEDVTNINGADVEDITPGKDETNTQDVDKNDDNSSTGGLNVGDSVEVDGKTYTVAENGDLVDDKGDIFKEVKDIPDWLKSVEIEDNNDDSELSISTIQEALGVTITDESGNPVEFTNDPNGVKSYVDSVISLRSNELQEAAINRLYNDNPLLKEFQDYVKLTGTARGFGEIPDRSGIQVEKDNEAQHIAIIRMAAQEFGNKTLNDNYIKYLRDTGGLYDEAKAQLEALVEKDKAVKQQIAQKAQEARIKEENEIKEYWDSVDKAINNRVISGYKIPESFTKEVDGKKMTVTPKDFFNYLSVPVEESDNGAALTGYQRDLRNLSNEDYLNRELLDAWLMFTGGSYKDLIDMAVKEDKVRQLKIKSKEQRTVKTVKINKNPSRKTDINDVIL